VNMLLRRL